MSTEPRKVVEEHTDRYQEAVVPAPPNFWYAFNDGYAIVGWGFVCPACAKYNMLTNYWEDVLCCERCSQHITSPGDPDGDFENWSRSK